jgi:hypothetical protein
MNEVVAVQGSRGAVRDILRVMVDDHELKPAQIAVLTGHNEKTVRYIIASQSFQDMLAKAFRLRHGAAADSVRANAMETTNAAFNTLRMLMQDTAVLPITKLEAVRIALDNHNKHEERLIPKTPPPTAPQNNVVINLTFDELQEARKNAIDYGKALELEPSDVLNPVAIPGPGRSQQ